MAEQKVEINAAFRQLRCKCPVVLSRRPKNLVSIWFWPDPNYRAGPAALQLVGLQCRAPGTQSRCTETCYVRSRVPGDRLNADAGSVGSSALQVAGRLRAELEARVSSHSRWLAELECGVIVLQVAGGCTALEYGGIALRVTG